MQGENLQPGLKLSCVQSTMNHGGMAAQVSAFVSVDDFKRRIWKRRPIVFRLSRFIGAVPQKRCLDQTQLNEIPDFCLDDLIERFIFGIVGLQPPFSSSLPIHFIIRISSLNGFSNHHDYFWFVWTNGINKLGCVGVGYEGRRFFKCDGPGGHWVFLVVEIVVKVLFPKLANFSGILQLEFFFVVGNGLCKLHPLLLCHYMKGWFILIRRHIMNISVVLLVKKMRFEFFRRHNAGDFVEQLVQGGGARFVGSDNDKRRKDWKRDMFTTNITGVNCFC